MDRYAPAEPGSESPRPQAPTPGASTPGEQPEPPREAGGKAPEDGPLTLPIIGLGDRHVDGRIDIGRLHTAGLNLDQMVIGVTARDGVTRFDPFTANVLGGKYAGTVEIDERGAEPVLEFDQQIVDIPFAELAAALFDHGELSGTASGGFLGAGTGVSVADVLSSLDGALFLELDEGALEGTDLWYEIRSAVAVVRGKPGPKENLGRTVFTRLGMTAEITDGLLRSEDLALQMPFLNVEGEGDLNLATQLVDFGLQATIRDTPEVAADPLGSELAGTTVPLRIRGPVDKPEVELDVENLLRGEATRRILERLLND
jgi:AsmA protein